MTRESYRSEVERLLQQINDRMHEVRVLKAYGARATALRRQKEELMEARLALAQTVRR